MSDTIEIENPGLCVDDKSRGADDELAAKAVEELIRRYADELEGIAEDLYQQELAERAAEAAIARYEDERNAPYSHYEEGKALDEYEHSHGW